MTLGDRRLEREVLEISSATPPSSSIALPSGIQLLAAAAAHTMVGSARGVGAWRVAEAAERLEGGRRRRRAAWARRDCGARGREP